MKAKEKRILLARLVDLVKYRMDIRENVKKVITDIEEAEILPLIDEEIRDLITVCIDNDLIKLDLLRSIVDEYEYKQF